MPPVTTPKEAKAQGLRWYFTGRPCVHGHVSKRNLINGECRSCVDARTRKRRAEDPTPYRAREKAKRDKDIEKARTATRAQWAKHREKRLAYGRAKYAADPGPKREASRRRYQESKGG